MEKAVAFAQVNKGGSALSKLVYAKGKTEGPAEYIDRVYATMKPVCAETTAYRTGLVECTATLDRAIRQSAGKNLDELRGLATHLVYLGENRVKIQTVLIGLYNQILALSEHFVFEPAEIKELAPAIKTQYTTINTVINEAKNYNQLIPPNTWEKDQFLNSEDVQRAKKEAQDMLKGELVGRVQRLMGQDAPLQLGNKSIDELRELIAEHEKARAAALEAEKEAREREADNPTGDKEKEEEEKKRQAEAREQEKKNEEKRKEVIAEVLKLAKQLGEESAYPEKALSSWDLNKLTTMSARLSQKLINAAADAENERLRVRAENIKLLQELKFKLGEPAWKEDGKTTDEEIASMVDDLTNQVLKRVDEEKDSLIHSILLLDSSTDVTGFKNREVGFLEAFLKDLNEKKKKTSPPRAPTAGPDTTPKPTGIQKKLKKDFVRERRNQHSTGRQGTSFGEAPKCFDNLDIPACIADLSPPENEEMYREWPNKKECVIRLIEESKTYDDEDQRMYRLRAILIHFNQGAHQYQVIRELIIYINDFILENEERNKRSKDTSQFLFTQFSGFEFDTLEGIRCKSALKRVTSTMITQEEIQTKFLTKNIVDMNAAVYYVKDPKMCDMDLAKVFSDSKPAAMRESIMASINELSSYIYGAQQFLEEWDSWVESNTKEWPSDTVRYSQIKRALDHAIGCRREDILCCIKTAREEKRRLNVVLRALQDRGGPSEAALQLEAMQTQDVAKKAKDLHAFYGLNDDIMGNVEFLLGTNADTRESIEMEKACRFVAFDPIAFVRHMALINVKQQYKVNLNLVEFVHFEGDCDFKCSNKEDLATDLKFLIAICVCRGVNHAKILKNLPEGVADFFKCLKEKYNILVPKPGDTSSMSSTDVTLGRVVAALPHVVCRFVHDTGAPTVVDESDLGLTYSLEGIPKSLLCQQALSAMTDEVYSKLKALMFLIHCHITFKLNAERPFDCKRALTFFRVARGSKATKDDEKVITSDDLGWTEYAKKFSKIKNRRKPILESLKALIAPSKKDRMPKATLAIKEMERLLGGGKKKKEDEDEEEESEEEEV